MSLRKFLTIILSTSILLATPIANAQQTDDVNTIKARLIGSYTIDTQRQAVIHHVEGAYSGNMLGRSMVRYFQLSADGSSLFLETRNNDRVTGRLRWDRITEEQ